MYLKGRRQSIKYPNKLRWELRKGSTDTEWRSSRSQIEMGPKCKYDEPTKHNKMKK